MVNSSQLFIKTLFILALFPSIVNMVYVFIKFATDNSGRLMVNGGQLVVTTNNYYSSPFFLSITLVAKKLRHGFALGLSVIFIVLYYVGSQLFLNITAAIINHDVGRDLEFTARWHLKHLTFTIGHPCFATGEQSIQRSS